MIKSLRTERTQSFSLTIPILQKYVGLKNIFFVESVFKDCVPVSRNFYIFVKKKTQAHALLQIRRDTA